MNYLYISDVYASIYIVDAIKYTLQIDFFNLNQL